MTGWVFQSAWNIRLCIIVYQSLGWQPLCQTISNHHAHTLTYWHIDIGSIELIGPIIGSNKLNYVELLDAIFLCWTMNMSNSFQLCFSSTITFSNDFRPPKRERPVAIPRLRKLLVQLTAGLGQVLTGLLFAPRFWLPLGLPRSGPKLREIFRYFLKG